MSSVHKQRYGGGGSFFLGAVVASWGFLRRKTVDASCSGCNSLLNWLSSPVFGGFNCDGGTWSGLSEGLVTEHWPRPGVSFPLAYGVSSKRPTRLRRVFSCGPESDLFLEGCADFLSDMDGSLRAEQWWSLPVTHCVAGFSCLSVAAAADSVDSVLMGVAGKCIHDEASAPVSLGWRSV